MNALRTITQGAVRAVLFQPLPAFSNLRSNNLTRRANHWHIFIIVRIKPAPENPSRAF
jgi:hypothetical protein